MKKLTRNIFKGIVRTEMLKVNPDWKVRNDVFYISEEGLRMIEERKITEKELREAIRGMAKCYLSSAYDYWAGMFYTAGPFEDNYDLSCSAFRRSEEYPKTIWDIELLKDTTFYINGRSVNKEGPSLKIWHGASNIGWYNFIR